MRAAVASWRSLLFMPADSARFVAAAARRGADAIILDLEDAIAPAAKESARRALADHADALAAQGLPVVIRVNAEPELLAADIAAAARPSVAAIMLPKVTSAADIVRIGAADIGLIPLIETPRGVMAAAEIAGADPRIAALAFGPEDFAVAMDIAPHPDALALPAQLVAMAARAAGCPAIGLAGSIAEIADLAALAATATRSRGLGLTGGLCIHPAQVPVINAAFGPTEAELRDARAIRDGFEAALARGDGAVAVAGRMVDRPVYLRALATLARACLRDRRNPEAASRPPE